MSLTRRIFRFFSYLFLIYLTLAVFEGGGKLRRAAELSHISFLYDLAAGADRIRRSVDDVIAHLLVPRDRMLDRFHANREKPEQANLEPDETYHISLP